MDSCGFAEIRKNPLRDDMISKLWREVELLRPISHVSVPNHLRVDTDGD